MKLNPDQKDEEYITNTFQVVASNSDDISETYDKILPTLGASRWRVEPLWLFSEHRVSESGYLARGSLDHILVPNPILHVTNLVSWLL